MSNVSSVTGNSVLDQYAVKDTSTKTNQLGKDQFMQLMIAQMNNQSPLNPQDNSQFIAQLAQFSSLEGINNLNSSVTSMSTQFRSSQALQASAMVGRSVLVPGTTASQDASGTIAGMVDLPASTSNLKVSVLDSSGQLVRQVDMGSQPGGEVSFLWDGKDSSGNVLPAGNYSLKAEASYNGSSQQVQTLLKANVNSVSIGTDGTLTLNLDGQGAVALSDVRQIG